MIHAILEILVFQLLFLALYDLFLRKETFFNLNRVYLLVTPVLSILLPFVSLGFIQQNIPDEYLVRLPAVMLGEAAPETGNSSLFSLENLYMIGVIGSSIIFYNKIFKLFKLRISAKIQNIGETQFRILPKTDAAFSFFDTIYLGENISEENREDIINHEKVHLRQKHSWDMLYFELLRIIFWFNPLVYMFQNRISTLHEYIADAEMTHQKDKGKYYQSLLSEVFQTKDISFTNPFFKESLIKKRIIMLQKSKSQRIKLMKYLLLFPILGLILIYTSCSETSTDLQMQEGVSTEMPPPPPPPPPPANRENVEIIEVREVGENEVSDVPFSVIDQVPIYPGCTGDNIAMKKCMSTNIAEFINSNFNTGIADDLNLDGRQRISVQFKIDKAGKVVDVRAKAKRPELEAEAIRVVEMLPQMLPGEQRGEKVGVLYSLPIVFEVK